jgi:hypothetical protein
LGRSLVDAFINHPARGGILLSLASIVEAGEPLSMPLVLLNPERYEDPRFREAAIIIKLTQKELDEQEARKLAQQTHQLAEEVPQLYAVCFRP